MAAALRSALASSLPQGFTLRQRQEADLGFLALLYASTREEELGPVPWTPAEKEAFLRDQFARQHAQYLEHYPRAEWLVIERGGEPVGRIYVEAAAREIRLMDVALLPDVRGQGVGTKLMRALVSHADALGVAVTLHVEPFNPAMRLYRRLGFDTVETRGYYEFMSRGAGSGALS